MMEEEDQSEKDSYLPDFSDIYDESFQFWDFMNQKETLKNRSFSNETTFDDGDYKRPYITSDHSSLLKKDDDSHTFWDFLSSRTENTKHSPEFFNSSNDKLEEKLQHSNGYRETCDESKVQQKYSSSDEFWDFLNSSVGDDKNSAAEAPFISCSSSETEKQIDAASCFETNATDAYNHILPRISSVCSLNTTSSVETLPETITPLSSLMNNSCELTKATYQPVVYNSSMDDYKMVYYAAQSTSRGNLSSTGSQSPLKPNSKTTHETVAHKNPVNDYKYYVVSNPTNCISHSNLKNSTEIIPQTVTHKNPTSGYKMENYADTLNLQNPIKNSFLQLRESPNSTSCSTPGSLNFEIQNLKKAENISHSESMCQNNTGTEPLYVLIPNSETLQKPNYSQYFIIVNNAQPQKKLNEDEAAKNIEQKTTAPNFSSTQNRQTVADDSFQDDIRLAGFRNNHILNVYKQKRKFEFLFDTPSSSESSCSIPVSSAPMDIDTLNSISARIKCKQNNFSETVKKQNIRQKPIKCIPLHRCKNAIQQIDVPITMEAFEANAKNNILEPCSTPELSKSNFDRKSIGDADKTPLFQSNNFSSQSNSVLSITFTQIPIWNEKYLITAPAKQNVAPSSCQVTKVHGMPLLTSREALPNSAKGLIFQETKPNKIILPKPPPSFVSSRDNNRVVPKMKKCRRKTVKELLLERQQNFRLDPGMASLVKLRESDISKYYVSEASLPFKVGNNRPVNLESICCDDPKNNETSLRYEGETTDQWPPEKSLRPRYYDMSELQIGLFKVQEDDDACGRFRSKFKVLFMKRQFLYDFPISRCNQPSLKTLQQELDDDMARIIVPFKAITSIHLKDRIIYLNVDSTPQLSLMNTQSRFAENNTIWSHFLESSFTHKVVLRKRQASKLKWILCQFDERFITLTDTTLGENQFDSPVSFKKRFNKSRKFVVRRPPEKESENLLFNQVCSCRTSCRSIRCSCVKAAKSCSSTCQCTNCNNPLNVLEAIGLDTHYSLKDCCLFQNIYQIPDLSNYLAREVRLDCCNCLARIQDCIPGTVLCPNINCNASLQYSWCQKLVSYQDRNPRNHCSLCGQCRFSNGRHCHMCKKCYAVTSKSNKCPTCQKEPLLQLPRRSLNTFCYDKNTSNLRSSKPQIVVLNSSSTKSQEESLCDFESQSSKE